MIKRQTPLLFYIIVGLAGIGLLSWVVKEPSSFVNYLFITALIAAVIFFIVRFIMKRRGGNAQYDEMKKYRQAVKQTKHKYKHYNKSNQQVKKPQRIRQKRRRPTHLTLIKGNKTRKKNGNDRASN